MARVTAEKDALELMRKDPEVKIEGFKGSRLSKSFGDTLVTWDFKSKDGIVDSRWLNWRVDISRTKNGRFVMTVLPDSQGAWIEAFLASRKLRVEPQYSWFRQFPRILNVRKGIRYYTQSSGPSVALRRGQYRDDGRRKLGERVNFSMAEYMRRTTLRVPQSPRGFQVPRYLYRGLKPPAKARPVMRDRSFTSWSRSQTMAKLFATKGGVVMRLDVSRIPRGTPWVWVGAPWRVAADSRVVTSVHGNNEEEVILPPGEIVVTRRLPTNKNNKNIDFVAVEFVPDRGATSVAAHKGKSAPFYPRGLRNEAHPYPLHALLSGGEVHGGGARADAEMRARVANLRARGRTALANRLENRRREAMVSLKYSNEQSA